MRSALTHTGTAFLVLAFVVSIGSAASVRAAEDQDPILEEVAKYIAEEPPDPGDPAWRTALPDPPILTFDAAKKYFWVLETSEGTLRFEFYPDIAPLHVSNAIYLTQLGFYDGLDFHRIIRGFMAQGGDPTGTGAGGPGYQFGGEFTKDRRGKHRKTGVLSTPNRGPGTDGSQFFVMFKPVKGLDGKHTVFGQMVEGKKTLKNLEKQGSKKGTPKTPVTILSARVVVE